MELNICHLYPDVLNLYGDRGNVMCMSRRLQWRGIGVNIKKLPIGSDISLAGCDLVFIGGGQDFEQEVLLEDLHRGRDREIKAAIEDGSLQVFDTATFTVEGVAQESFMADVDTDPAYTPDTEVVHDGYFSESEFRSAPYFDLEIDGITRLDTAF